MTRKRQLVQFQPGQPNYNMNADEAVTRAIKEPTLAKALSWICVWESERAIAQARFNYGSGQNGAGWDTCFEYLINLVLDKYKDGKSNIRNTPRNIVRWRWNSILAHVRR